MSSVATQSPERGSEASAARPHGRAAAGVLLVAMAVGSLAIWIVLPAFWFWLAGQLTDDYPSIYLLVLAACPLSMIGFAVLIRYLDVAYYRVRGEAMPAPGRAAWLKAVSGERGRPRQRTPLDVFMTVSAVLAMAALLVWMFGFAASPLNGRI